VASPFLKVIKQDMGLHLGYLTLLLWSILSANVDACVFKECECSDEAIDCSFLELTKMPQAVSLSGTYQTLLLSENKITVIPANSLPSNLSEIDLLNNPTTIIADTALDGSVYTLQTIILSFAHFTRIPNAFGHLRALKSLTIQNVDVQDWNDDAMMIGGQTLTSLTLYNVSLSSWPNWIQNCSQLTYLSITYGSIQSIPDGALDNFSNSLTSLVLSNNKLTSIPKALSQLSALTSLSLDYNKIIDVTWLPQHSPQLTQIYLDNNKISNSSSLSQAVRQIGSSLKYIGITSNQLTSIPDFTSMTRINNLDFSKNKISNPYSGSVPNTVDSIDLSYNFLHAIPRFVSTLNQAISLTFLSNVITSFVGTNIPPSAIVLDLGSNLITEITDNNFPKNSQLTTLSLNNNPIVLISNLAFTNLLNLTGLNFINTKITRLPLGLRSLTSLTWIDLTDSNGLVCTCMEKCLESWVVNLSPNQVYGNCGMLPIYDFFSQLSPDCPTQCCNETECIN
jgi:Leucine-rich repeat (LRR) protein